MFFKTSETVSHTWGKHISIVSNGDGQQILLTMEIVTYLRRLRSTGLLHSVELFSVELYVKWSATHLSDGGSPYSNP